MQDDSVVPSYNHCHDIMSDNQNTYTLTLHAAADLLGVSERTVQRHAKSGRLSSIYVRGRKGRELRFQKDEVLKFGTTVSSHVEGSHHDSHDTNASSDRYSLNINELLTRHEQAMFQLGQMQAKLTELKMLEEQAQSLKMKADGLSQEKQTLEERINVVVTEKQQLDAQAKALTEANKKLKVSNWVYTSIVLLAIFLWITAASGILGLAREQLANIFGLSR